MVAIAVRPGPEHTTPTVADNMFPLPMHRMQMGMQSAPGCKMRCSPGRTSSRSRVRPLGVPTAKLASSVIGRTSADRTLLKCNMLSCAAAALAHSASAPVSAAEASAEKAYSGGPPAALRREASCATASSFVRRLVPTSTAHGSTSTSPPSRVAGGCKTSMRAKPSERNASVTGARSSWREGAPEWVGGCMSGRGER